MQDSDFDKSIEFYGLSYDELLSEFQQLARNVLPDWDTANINDDLVKVTRLFLQSLARSNKFAANLIQETNPITARDIRSLQTWAKLFNVPVRTRQPAIATVRLFYDINSDITINPYELELTITSDAGVAVSYHNVSTIVLKYGQDFVDAVFTEGKNFIETFTYNGQDSILLSQRFVVDEIFLAKSLYVKVNGYLWTRVNESEMLSQLSAVYGVTIDNNEQARIVFGSTVFGIKPPIGATIEVFYRICAGTMGNVKANFDEDGNPLSVFAVRDQQKFSMIISAFLLEDTGGASDPITIQELKRLLISGVSYKGQLTNVDDVNRYLLFLPGIMQVRTNIFLFNIISTIVISYFSSSVKSAIERDVQSKIPSLFTFEVRQAKEQLLKYEIFVLIDKSVSQQFITESIKNFYERFLDYSFRDVLTNNYTNPIGETVYLSTLGQMIKSLKGVLNYNIEVYDLSSRLVASTQSSTVKPYYVNAPDTVTSKDSTLDLVIDVNQQV